MNKNFGTKANGGFSFLMKMLILVVCAAFSTSAFYAPNGTKAFADGNEELRGVWISTVANIDYPSQQTTDSNVLKNDLINILDNCKDMGFNAVFFQVRPCGDALYKSSIFPWSKYLTGTQGLAPNDGFDPLQFAVEEAHARGMQLHAWINPYRITNTSADNPYLAKQNPAVLNPNLVIQDSNGKMYYNPGDQASIDLIVDGAAEIVQNYDVDGLHMDDYFYPDGGYNDDGTYAYYKDEYPDKAAWRRSNVDKLVKTMDERLHSIKANIQFGISPRGIWANKSDMAEGSDTNGGGSYTAIYADSRGWVKNGWVDYIMPQIYWNIGYKIADYSVLCDWWSDVVAGTGVRLYIGEAAYRTVSSTTEAWRGENGVNELRTHILNGRANPNISGYCCFTYNNFIKNNAIYALMKEVNSEAAEAPGGAILVNGDGQNDNSSQTQDTPPALEEESGVTGNVSNNDSSLSADKPSENSGEYKNKFTDMNDYWWAMDSVNELAAKGIIKGRSETEFDPDAKITRADNTVLLLRVLNKTAEFTDNFDDVYPGKYYYNEIGMAKALGIASGVGGNCFDPDAKITREDMASLAYRVLSKEGKLTSIPNTTVLNNFTDKDDIYFYAREPLAACINAGLMGGYGDGTLNPKGYASRVEVAIFIHRISKLI